MGRFFSIIIIFAFLAIIGGYVWVQKSEESAREQLVNDRAAARRTFEDKARAAAQEEDADAYVRSVQAALRAYDEELKKKVYKERPEWRNPAAYEAEVEQRFKEGKLKEAQHKSMLEGYKIVREAYDTVMAANWRPVLTAKGKGGTRLDIYSLKRATDDEGKPILEGQFLFWGIEDSTQMSWGQLSMRFWKKEMQEVREGGRRVQKEVELVLGKAEGESEPHIIIQSPDKYVADFPKYVAIGTMWLPVMPREAHAVDLQIGYTAKIGGTAYDTMLSFEKLAIPEAWKLKEGEAWEADTIEATEDEIVGREAGTE